MRPGRHPGRQAPASRWGQGFRGSLPGRSRAPRWGGGGRPGGPAPRTRGAGGGSGRPDGLRSATPDRGAASRSGSVECPPARRRGRRPRRTAGCGAGCSPAPRRRWFGRRGRASRASRSQEGEEWQDAPNVFSSLRSRPARLGSRQRGAHDEPSLNRRPGHSDHRPGDHEGTAGRQRPIVGLPLRGSWRGPGRDRRGRSEPTSHRGESTRRRGHSPSRPLAGDARAPERTSAGWPGPCGPEIGGCLCHPPIVPVRLLRSSDPDRGADRSPAAGATDCTPARRARCRRCPS